jgi:YfiH family protein
MIEAATLALPGIRHGFFTRRGGVSEGPFESLNMGLRNGDVAAHVQRNRASAAGHLGFGPAALCTAMQVHGIAVVHVDEPFAADIRPEADGLVTASPGVLLGVLTADCAPVLLADPDAGVTGAAHAGWRGALAGIVEATIDAMLALGARRERIRAAIGPCIAQRSYEVGPEFRAQFLREAPSSERFFAIPNGTERPRFDLSGYVESRLRAAGVATCESLGHDTCADEARFFSWRRTSQRGETRFGVQLSAIGIAA